MCHEVEKTAEVHYILHYGAESAVGCLYGQDIQKTLYANTTFLVVCATEI